MAESSKESLLLLENFQKSYHSEDLNQFVQFTNPRNSDKLISVRLSLVHHKIKGKDGNNIKQKPSHEVVLAYGLAIIYNVVLKVLKGSGEVDKDIHQEANVNCYQEPSKVVEQTSESYVQG